eukprot:778191-Prymnesium_polylepis.1
MDVTHQIWGYHHPFWGSHMVRGARRGSRSDGCSWRDVLRCPHGASIKPLAGVLASIGNPLFGMLVCRKWGYLHGYVADSLRRFRRKNLWPGPERQF